MAFDTLAIHKNTEQIIRIVQKLSFISNLDKIQKSSSSIFECRGSSFFRPVIQTKLTINQPNDVYEQEADAVSDKVMRMSNQDIIQTKFFRPGFSSLQRKCADCEEEEKNTQRKEIDRREPNLDSNVENYIGSLNSKGQPLSDDVKSFYEPRFSHDFSHVKIHTDSAAAKSAQSINALAYTSGNNIVFNSGQYAPNSETGRRLLGHELTHVVQQKNGSANTSSTTVQRAMICSKRLEAFIGRLGINHAYIDDTGGNDCLGSGMAGNYAVQTLVSGNFVRGCAAKTDRSTDPQSFTPNKKPCNPKAGVTNLSQCLRDAYNSYADPSVYANPFGPNSNTFAATLARTCCEDSTSSGLGIVPGWGHSPAPPCVLMAENQTCEPQNLGGGAYLGEDCIVRQGAGPKY